MARQVWQAEDGETFETQAEAERHEREGRRRLEVFLERAEKVSACLDRRQERLAERMRRAGYGQ